MISRIPYEVDAFGVPLPIIPILSPAHTADAWTDFHHHFHPKYDPALQDEGGKLLRRSFGQLIERRQHNRIHQIFDGPPLPETTEEKFASVVLTLSKYMPDEGILLTNTNDAGFERVPLSETDKELIRANYIGPAGQGTSRCDVHIRAAAGKFFATYALEQDLGHVNEGLVDEFICTEDDRRRKEIGHLLIKEAVRVAADPVEPLHTELAAQGLLPEATPRKAAGVVTSFFVKSRYPDYLEALTERLSGSSLNAHLVDIDETA